MIEVKKIKEFEIGEIEELTSATMDAIQEGIGFGWIKKPAKKKLLNIGKELFWFRIDGFLLANTKE